MNREEAEALFGLENRTYPPYGKAFRCVILDKREYPAKDKNGNQVYIKDKDGNKIPKTFKLEPISKLMLFYLDSRCIDTDVTWVSQETIAYDLGITREWVSKKIKTLIQLGMVLAKKIPTQTGNHNVYCLVDVKKIYGEDIAMMSWLEIDKARLESLKHVNCGSHGRDVNHSSHLNVNSNSHLKVNHSSQELEERETEELKKKNICPSDSYISLSEFKKDSEEENSEEENNTENRETTKFSKYNKWTKSSDSMSRLRKDEEQKRKAEEKIKAENRFLKKLPKMNLQPGQTKEDWEQSRCAYIFHECFRICMTDANYFVPKTKIQGGDIGAWKKGFFPKVGSIEIGTKMIEWLIANWGIVVAATKGQLEAGTPPTINLLCSKFVDQHITKMLSARNSSEPRKQVVNSDMDNMGYSFFGGKNGK